MHIRHIFVLVMEVQLNVLFCNETQRPFMTRNNIIYPMDVPCKKGQASVKVFEWELAESQQIKLTTFRVHFDMEENMLFIIA